MATNSFDVASVFRTFESVNALLRSVISALTSGSRPKTAPTIKIWAPVGVVYDKQGGAPDDGDPNTVIASGNIVIHSYNSNHRWTWRYVDQSPERQRMQRPVRTNHNTLALRNQGLRRLDQDLIKAVGRGKDRLRISSRSVLDKVAKRLDLLAQGSFTDRRVRTERPEPLEACKPGD